MYFLAVDLLHILVIGLIIGGIGAILGLILAIASEKLKVEVDPKYEQILETLPGFNCGACGHPGCSGLAQSIIDGEGNVNQCTPSTKEIRDKVMAILKGTDVEVVETPKPKPAKPKREVKEVTNDDPRFNKIVELLPGLNCFACGQPGCKAFADELIKGNTEVDKCIPLKKKEENKVEINKLLDK